jgi:hypothetical protein
MHGCFYPKLGITDEVALHINAQFHGLITRAFEAQIFA